MDLFWGKTEDSNGMTGACEEWRAEKSFEARFRWRDMDLCKKRRKDSALHVWVLSPLLVLRLCDDGGHTTLLCDQES